MIAGPVLAAAILVLVSQGAEGSQVSPGKIEADEIAGRHGWTAAWLEAGRFDLLSYVPATLSESGELTVYIEGDGKRWITPTERPDDPTPLTPSVLELALSDTGDAAYLARPCQYLPSARLGACSPDFWSLARYGEDAVASIDAALDVLKARTGAEMLRLVGFSGGGQLAVLAAARRDDIRGIITIAGNLDHRIWTRHLDVTPLRDSLNAADVAQAVQHIPQVHYLGEEDTNVTRMILDGYLGRMTDAGRSHVIVVPDFTHSCCWEDAWPGLVAAAVKLMSEP